MSEEAARAAFERFTVAVESEPLRAAAAAFAYVACSDGEIAASEEERFRQWLSELHPDAAGNSEAWVHAFSALAEAFTTDFAVAESLMEETLRSVGSNEQARETVLQGARVAVIADGALRPVEEVALRRLSEVLGVPASEV